MDSEVHLTMPLTTIIRCMTLNDGRSYMVTLDSSDMWVSYLIIYSMVDFDVAQGRHRQTPRYNDPASAGLHRFASEHYPLCSGIG